MPEMHQLLMFILAGVLLNLTPGPDVLFIVNQSLRGGVRPGLVAAWGITAGCFVHVAAAAGGVGALLATSAEAFNVIKWAGAAYLLWVGARLLLARPDPHSATDWTVAPDPGAGQPERLGSVFWRAFATNVLNPKVALFFLAFVPQFIPAQASDPAWRFVLLGALFNFNGLLIGMGWALAASWLYRRTALLQRSLHQLDRLAGLMFVGFGFKLALTDAPAT